MDLLKQMGAMLRAEDPHKRIAAAMVLGELKVKDANIVKALAEMAQDPFDAYAHAAISALGNIGTMKALPALLNALGRGGETQKLAAKALAGLGEEALPEIKAKLEDAPPELRAAVSQALPSMGGKASFQLTLEGLRGQPWDAINKVALSVRQEVKAASDAERKAMRTQLDKFLGLKKTSEDEAALRGAVKILGYLELAETVDTLLGYAGAKNPPMIRIEAITALRFALGRSVTAKAMKRLGELLLDMDPLVRRAARDTVMTLKFGPQHADGLAVLAEHEDFEVASWAISLLGTMGGQVAEKTLVPLASGSHKGRAQAAAKAITQIEGGERLLASALCKVDDETGAQVLSEALMPLAKKLAKKDLSRLLAAGEANLSKSVAIGRRQLDPVLVCDPEGWAEAFRANAKAAQKKDPARSGALLQILCRSPHATLDDRYLFARMELMRSPMDPHPRARSRDGALAELERLADAGAPLAKLLEKDKTIDDEALYYLGFHFVERVDSRDLGAALLELLIKRSGRTKLGKAAKNKLALVAE